MKTLDYDVVRDEKHPYSALRVPIQAQQSTKLLFPEEIAAEIILKLKRMAENRLEEKVTHVVITVPSYFDNDQRQATKDAAAMVGLMPLRLVTEPTAACIGHGIDRQQFRDVHDNNDDEGLIIVYDIGTGDSEVTLESIDRGVFEKLSSAGNRHFSKFHLTVRGSTEVPQDERQHLARSPLFLVEKVLKDAKLQKNQVDGVVITGSPTDVAHIKPVLEEIFPGKKFYDDVPADEVVIRGAAKQAELLSEDEDDTCDGMFLMDVSVLSLWVETSEGILTKLIPRNTVIPARKARVFSTATDKQSKAVFRIYEGERPLASQNKLLGALEHKWIPLAPRGVPEIEVSFEIDAEWQLNVVAQEKKTGIESNISVSIRSQKENWVDVDKYTIEAENNHESDAMQKEAAIKSAVEGEPRFGVITEDSQRGLWY
jgi:molecular chaperone DnaK (HSP70)